jgi:hypothetical protein
MAGKFYFVADDRLKDISVKRNMHIFNIHNLKTWSWQELRCQRQFEMDDHRCDRRLFLKPKFFSIAGISNCAIGVLKIGFSQVFRGMERWGIIVV